jgi:D-glycerate 3-kinase
MNDRRIADTLRAVFAQERIAADAGDAMIPAYAAIARWLVARREGTSRTLVAGICGAQGSGKSTMAAGLQAVLEHCAELHTAVLSIDDFYLSKTARQALAHDVHPLFATRGVPGTHDVARAAQTISALAALGPGETVALPSFSKADDDVVPERLWPLFTGKPDIILLEGWCAGARPEPDDALATPVNMLERAEDREGIWRHAVNDALAGPYHRLFGRLDMLLLIAAPGFDHILSWRREQERKLAERIRSGEIDGAAIMDDRALSRFVMHYERLTRHILREMPARADGVLTLGGNRAIRSLTLQ